MPTTTAEIRLLGPPLLRLAGRPARLHSSKTLALLAYLSLTGEVVHSREKLASLLWGESPDARARQSLRQALYSLRQTFGPQCLVVEGDAVTWSPGSHVWVDATAFLSLVAGGEGEALREAAALYRGLLLEGAEPSDCPAYDEWLFFQRDRLEQHLAGALERLVDAHLAGVLPNPDAHRDALAYGQRLAALNPLHESAHRRLMRVYGALGDADGVRRQYLACREALERELGVEPSHETRDLYRALTAPQPAPPPSPAAPDRPQAGERPPALPFLGRERALGELCEHLDRVLRGQGRLVLVAGESGSGKTALVESFLHGCAARVHVLAGRCYAPEFHAPYAIWTDALQELGRPDNRTLLAGLDPAWRQQVARLVPALGPSAGDIAGATPAESRLRLLQGIVQALAHLALHRPAIVWLDDLHWADEASLELLHYVARQLASRPLLLLCAYHPGAVPDNPALGRLLASPHVTHTLHLAPLDPAAIRRMLQQSGIAAEPDLVERLHRRSGGNPLYLVETLHTLFESGHVRRRADGLWEVTEREHWPVPARVLDLIRARLASLDEQERRVLAVGAVVGRPFGLRLLRRIGGLPELEALDVLERVRRRGYLQEHAAGSGQAPDEPALAFRHVYLQRAVYEDLGAVRRRALHRRTADALLQLHRQHHASAGTHALTQEVAYHYEQAGDPEAVTYLAQAAQQALALYSYQRAAALCGSALDLLGPRAHGRAPEQKAADRQRFDLLLVREEALDRQGLRTEQAADVAELKRLADAMADPECQAMAYIREAGFLSYAGPYDAARQAGERALALYRAAGDPAGEGRALRELGFLSWAAEDYAAALGYARDALQLHRRLGDVAGEATALHNLAEIHRSLGSPRQSIAQYEMALELYWARQDRQRQGLTLYGLGTAYRQLGALEDALLRYRQALAHCRAAGDPLMVSRIRHALAGVHWQRGNLPEALDEMEQAVETSREIGYGPGIAHGLVSLSHLQAQAGRLDRARAHLVDAIAWLRLTEDEAGLAEAQAQLDAMPQEAPPGVQLLSAPNGWVKGHVALAEGKVYCAFESPIAGCGPAAELPPRSL